VVTREEIPSGLRGPDHVAGSNAVDQQIRCLRARVQDDRRRPRSIAAGPGRRYRFLPTSRENGTAAASLRRADRRIHVPGEVG
jgi:DNA-binding response OmpR family regulator